MKLAIMQPYFLPYIGYWQLFAAADTFVIFDVVKFHKRSWMNRNRILHSDPSKNFSYISLPIESSYPDFLISDAKVAGQHWKKSLRGSLSVYKRMRAAYYKETLQLTEEILSIDEISFNRFIKKHCKLMLDHLNISCPIVYASEIDFDRSNIKGPGDWALAISKQLGASKYINPPGGVEIFDAEKYCDNGVKLEFLKPNLIPYQQGKRDVFVDALSILDVLMFNGASNVKKILFEDYKLLSKQELSQG